MRKRVARSGGGFTLVELLVVIAIIAVLISILLPTIARARDQAIALKCANNLRQVVIAMSAYESEYRSYPFLNDASYGQYHVVAFFAGNVELIYPPLRSPTGRDDNHPFAPSRFTYD
jgi:prepilin-type N-terminal cleavage/methylation domain-containing protein